MSLKSCSIQNIPYINILLDFMIFIFNIYFCIIMHLIIILVNIFFNTNRSTNLNVGIVVILLTKSRIVWNNILIVYNLIVNIKSSSIIFSMILMISIIIHWYYFLLIFWIFLFSYSIFYVWNLHISRSIWTMNHTNDNYLKQ